MAVKGGPIFVHTSAYYSVFVEEGGNGRVSGSSSNVCGEEFRSVPLII